VKLMPTAHELITLADKHGFTYYEAQGLIQMGWARTMTSADPDGYEQLREGYTLLKQTGTVLGLRGAQVQLAEASMKLGRMDLAASILSAAELNTAARSTRCWDAEMLRLRAEVTAHTGDDQEADEVYAAALETAARQGARSLQLRCVLSWAKRLRARGRPDRARALLKPVLESFSEGHTAIEIADARELLIF
jgi:tetratricopeptide (TPR) repeat protein